MSVRACIFVYIYTYIYVYIYMFAHMFIWKLYRWLTYRLNMYEPPGLNPQPYIPEYCVRLTRSCSAMCTKTSVTSRMTDSS